MPNSRANSASESPSLSSCLYDKQQWSADRRRSMGFLSGRNLNMRISLLAKCANDILNFRERLIERVKDCNWLRNPSDPL